MRVCVDFVYYMTPGALQRIEPKGRPLWVAMQLFDRGGWPGVGSAAK